MKALVIGAGFGGIAAALRLRAKGYEVTLLERGTMLGGRAQVFEREGFRHDAGPTVITAPFLLEELFALLGEKLADHVKLVPMKPWYRFRFHDGSTFDYGGTLEETLAEIAKLEPKDCEGYRKLLAHSEKIYRVGFEKLSAAPFHSFLTMLRQVPALLRLRSYETVWQMVARHLRDKRLRQAFSIQPLLVGGNPFETTSIYGLIHYLERAHGVHFAMGGTGALVKALGELMQRHGVQVCFNATVRSLRIEDGTAKGVELDDGTVLAADLVVSNADAPYLHTHLVPQSARKTSVKLKLATASYSMGLYILYFGTKKPIPQSLTTQFGWDHAIASC